MLSVRLVTVSVLVVSALVLQGCSPIYKTNYSYHPIAGKQGQMCSNTCLVSKQSCIQHEQQSYQQCESQAQMAYQMCEASKVWAYNAKGNLECVANCSCWRSSCSEPDYGRCEETYKDCYLNCGGEVTATTACTQFCDETAAPPVVQRLKLDSDGSIIDVMPTGGEKTKRKSSAKTTSSAKKQSPTQTKSSAGADSSAQSEIERITQEMRIKTETPAAPQNAQ